MGLTRTTSRTTLTDKNISCSNTYSVALAGNPNVGKSTVFNALTGMNQHTGNWTGKTVSNACGNYTYKDKEFTVYDIPGTYSLHANSAEEEVARDLICFDNADCIVIVADATSLERNLNLVLQISEICDNIILCVNLLDEAAKKGITVDLQQLENEVGVKVVGCSAREGKGLTELQQVILEQCTSPGVATLKLTYNSEIETLISNISTNIKNFEDPKIKRWIALRILDSDSCFVEKIFERYNINKNLIDFKCTDQDRITDSIVTTISNKASQIYAKCVREDKKGYSNRDRKIDRILTSAKTGIPIMLILLAAILWLTIEGANYPSDLLASALFKLQDILQNGLAKIGCPSIINDFLLQGIYKTVAWIVSVMLPPMAIFFPLFTLLEDLGYLPRVAFNLDRCFKRAGASGKQSLTSCMGLGCNACGVIGCRIIDSPRERLVAILTNSFIPCNGRFPALISVIAMFFTFSMFGPFQSAISALILTAFLIFAFLMSLLISKILSVTIFKGLPSSFTLELPPYRRPQIGRVIIRSIFDRTLFVLGRALSVAVPAGAIIWIFANINISGTSILSYCTDFLDPFGKLIGLDGTIILAFILGFPANEIVIPIIIMSYTATGNLMSIGDLSVLKELFISNGWTLNTALCMAILILFHFPCATTCLTIKKETGSWKWTAISIFLPFLIGIFLCFIVSSIFTIFRL